MKGGRIRITLRSLGAQGALNRLARAGVPVLAAEKRGKNVLTLEVARKDREKVFAILRDSCYNVEKEEPRGLRLLLLRCARRAGLIAGTLLFCIAVLFAETRVLKVEVVGNGAYYEEEVLSVLSRGGIGLFSALPSETSALTEEILALPRVSYCGMRCEGGILTVEVRVSDENVPLGFQPLLAPRAGRVEELTVVRGTALVSVGDEAEKEQPLVAAREPLGEGERAVIVIARATLSYPVSVLLAGSEAEAVERAEALFGRLGEIHTERTEEGILVSGRARLVVSLNL